MGSDAATVVHVVSTLEGGGTERTLVSLVSSFADPSLRHAVVTLREAGSLAERLPPHVQCISLGYRGRTVRAGWALASVLRRLAPAIVHTRGTGCWFDCVVAAVLAKSSPCCLGFHGRESTTSFGVTLRLVVRAALAMGARFTSVSLSGGQRLERELGIPGDRIEVIPNGVPLDRFSQDMGRARQSVRSELGVPADAFVVMSVGSLTAIKRYDLLIAAAEKLAPRLPRLLCLIAGEGPYRDALERQVQSHNIAPQVRLLGVREDIPRLLAAADVYVCSSDSEGMSNSVLEALAAGCPIVATDVGDNAHIIREGAEGVLVPPGSAGRLARAIHAIAADGNLRAAMSAAALRRAADYDFRRTVALYEAYYRRQVSPSWATTQPNGYACNLPSARPG